jgi:hypothetical protein
MRYFWTHDPHFIVKMPLFSLIVALISMHSFYVGITTIERTSEGENHITIQVFSDDLALAVFQKAGQESQLANQTPATDSLLKRYVMAHLGIFNGTTRLPIQFLGYEQQGDQTFLYLLNAKGSQAPDRIVNNLLMERFERQIHIIQYTEGNCRWSDYTRREQPSLAIRCP